MFEGQPKGLFALALANTGERFGYYTMLAVFALFLRANYGLSFSPAFRWNLSRQVRFWQDGNHGYHHHVCWLSVIVCTFGR